MSKDKLQLEFKNWRCWACWCSNI